MWGVGTLIGPASGGLFAQFGLWRAGFGVLAVGAVLMALLVPVALPARVGEAPKKVCTWRLSADAEASSAGTWGA
jgi:MFS family permease